MTTVLKQRKNGFTIVELLIVIVVIGILAAITLVVLSRLQERARYTKAHSDLSAINKALLSYKAINGSLPYTGTWDNENWRYYCNYSDPNDFIPGLTTVIAKIPEAPCRSTNVTSDTWVYGSDGQGYKLIFVRTKEPSSYADWISPAMQDPNGWSPTAITWGYWTEDNWRNS